MRARPLAYPLTARALAARIQQRYPQYQLIDLEHQDVITGQQSPITVRCTHHDQVFSTRPRYLLQECHGNIGHCHVCVPNGKKMFYADRLPELLRERCPVPLRYVDERYAPYEPIHGHRQKIMIECQQVLANGQPCGHRWEARINNLLSGYGCPACDGRRRAGQGDSVAAINHWLRHYGLRAVARDGQRITFVCPSGHVAARDLNQLKQLRGRTPDPTQRRRVCPVCRERLAYYRHRRAATQQGMLLDAPLSAWAGATVKYAHRCLGNPAHRHQVSPNALQHWDGGCPDCRQERQWAQHYAECQAIITQRHGRLLSPADYRGSAKPLQCQCQYGHHFETSRDKLLQGGWCPVCMSGYGERLARFAMEHLFQAPFPRTRPAFLINPASGRRLEFDGYAPALGLAFEHQGQQHLQIVPYYHRDDAFVKAQQRDVDKRALATAHGITLVEIPVLEPSLTPYEVLARVSAACLQQGIQVPSRGPLPDLSPVFLGSANQIKLQQLIHDRGGQALSGYQGLKRPITLRCAQPAHPPWTTTPFGLLYARTWCPRCAAERRLMPGRQRVAAWLVSASAALLDGPYRGSRVLHAWRCAAGHESHRRYATIQLLVKDGKPWCRQCAAAARGG